MLDENGKIVDLIYRDVNDRFATEILKREDCIGKFNSELFPDSMLIFFSLDIQLKNQYNTMVL